VKRLENGLYEICAEHNIVWFSDDVTCGVCEELASVRVTPRDTTHMTIGDLQGEMDRVVDAAVQNMQKMGRR
jgi:hypothetical protein